MIKAVSDIVRYNVSVREPFGYPVDLCFDLFSLFLKPLPLSVQEIILGSLPCKLV